MLVSSSFQMLCYSEDVGRKKIKDVFLLLLWWWGGSREGGMSYLVRSFLFLLYLFVFLLSGHDVDWLRDSFLCCRVSPSLSGMEQNAESCCRGRLYMGQWGRFDLLPPLFSPWKIFFSLSYEMFIFSFLDLTRIAPWAHQWPCIRLRSDRDYPLFVSREREIFLSFFFFGGLSHLL